MSGFDTIWPADSVEFCPHPDFHDVFVCGTYKLEETGTNAPEERDNIEQSTSPVSKKQKRRGECLLFEVNPNVEEQCSLLQKTALPAILDIKWCHRAASASPRLAVADSEGRITLHSLQQDEEPCMEQVQTIACASEDILCLSIDWSNRRAPSTSLGSLVVSLSDGSLALLHPDDAGMTVTDSWHAHDYEPWIAAWDYWDTNIVYSGGDDLKMKGWDIREGFTQPIFTNKRFDAGVTTIHSHPFVEHLLAVGTYDNTVRLFDTRKPLVPFTQADVGGGAWRVKWHPSPSRKNDLLVACMHDGFKVIRFDLSDSGDAELGQSFKSSADPWQVVTRYDAHKSLAYGVDWSFRGENEGIGNTLIASCSFYDHTLRLWRG
ncbi:WD-40 repeat-containing protein [Laetiporus sulphureus 93-53]|uniref:methylated diphthine methylhydrolase n=1 Tax=Laetiporus sulphureus 93-53 TaxID=1314785 RepID=A0A165CFI4_9APHY|nr:WD-40 repeat-containing protein [Laetiporus sulphureus 93-53]KZT02717.1 WD-40 repeat-containing protein [Laetiporus sulphureus 93-53]